MKPWSLAERVTYIEGMSPTSRLPALVATLLFFAFALFQAVGTNNLRDFFIFRLGAELAARGENPYDVPRVRGHIAAQYPDAKEFIENSGYFLPPQAVVLFLPFAALPWTAAKVLWAIAIGVAAYFIARLPVMLRDGAQPSRLTAWLLPFVMLLNPLSLAVVVVGQFTIVFVGCVAAGLFCFERGQSYLAAALWAIPFVKPHLAIPLIPLAWYLGGWKPAALLVVLVAILNAAGATLVGGSPLFLREYVNYLPTAREVVAFNRVEMNPNTTSWNRLVYAWGGPLVELGAVTIVAGYLVWLGLVVGRWAVTGEKPSAAWATAATAAGAVVFAQVLVYELLFLFVAAPWMCGLFASGYRVRGWLAVLLLVVHLVPDKVLESSGVDRYYHALAAALFAGLVLWGPASSVTQRGNRE
jgi:glycosyl transferase family 87